jgi:hypothetical protein
MYNFNDYIDEAIRTGEINTQKPVEELVRLIKQDMHLERWGFSITKKGVSSKVIRVVLCSEICKVKLFCTRDNGQLCSISLDYARLHAPDEEGTYMFHEDQKCICWHNLFFGVLDFLDGMTPEEAVNSHWSGKRIIGLEQEPKIANLGKYNPERTLYFHDEIWTRYAPELFQLFDLRDQTLWKKYYEFNKEYVRLEFKGSTQLSESWDLIC